MKVLFFLIFSIAAYTSSAQKVQAAIETLYKKYPQEKVVLSYSKPEYVAGETIFFKAYVLTGYEPTEVSTNLYTELYDKDRNVIQQAIIPLFNGSGEGSFVLPPSLEENVYYVRAYTRYMLNYDEAFQYLKPLNIYNPYSAKKLQPKPEAWTAAVFAEGGKLLNGITAKLSVRIYTTSTLPQTVKAQLVEKGTNNFVADVTMLNNETGTVLLTPVDGKQYAIKLTDNNGKEQWANVPAAASAGTALSLNVREEAIDYTVAVKNIPGNGAGYKLMGTVHDQVVFLASIKKSGGTVSGSINTVGMPAGVMRLTLFDEKETPLNERLCFLHQQLKTVQPAISTDTLSFAEKGRNRWSVSLDSTSWPSYAVQVSDAGYTSENSFLSDVYLTSDFTTPLQNSASYFTNLNDAKREALDALLITEKWERFAWSEILAGRFPIIRFLPDAFLSYAALAHKAKKPQPLKDINLIVKGKDSSVQFIQVKTDSTGRFVMQNLIFTDTVRVYYQANKRKTFERDVELEFEALNKFQPYKKVFPPSAMETVVRGKNDEAPPAVQRAMAQRATELLIKEKTKMLEEVVISTKAKNATQQLNEKLSSGIFSSLGERVFDFINEDQTAAMGYTNLLDWLVSRVPGFSVERFNDTVVPYLRGGIAELFIDEIPVDPATLISLSAGEVAMIKVVSGITLGIRGGNGAILIYTRRAGQATQFSTPTLLNNFLAGYQKQPLPFVPDYSDESLKNTEDKRAILFRTGLLRPDTKQKGIIAFYNNDTAKSYRVTITGFTAAGRLVYMEKDIQ